MNKRQSILAGLAAALLAITPTHLPSCGPFFPEAIFSFEHTPAAMESDIVAGRLGVIQPSYRRRYLVFAWRYLAAKPLTAVERQQLDTAGAINLIEHVSAPSAWMGVRSKYAPRPANPYVRAERYRSKTFTAFTNCTDDAFVIAIKTLEERVRQFGADHAAVKDWMIGQDTVFSNCAEGPAAIPGPAPAGVPPTFWADREYQIAAAYFYSESFEEAHRRFLAISRNRVSPWKSIAPYVAARCWIRKGTLKEGDGTAELKQAQSELAAIVNDPKQTAIHPAASRLLHFVNVRLEPARELEALTTALSDPKQEADFHRNLTDYLYLAERPGAKASGELSEWIGNFQNASAEGLDAAIARYDNEHSLPWLVAALTKLPGNHPRAAELLEAATRVPSDSPGYATLTYFRLSVNLAAGRNDAVRAELDKLLPTLRKNLPPSAANLFLRQRMSLAANLDDMLLHAPRYVAATALFGESDSSPRTSKDPELLLDQDSAAILSRGLPLAMLHTAARSRRLPPHIRQRIALAAWTRSVLVDDEKGAKSITPTLTAHYPRLKQDLARYSNASGDAARFEAAYLMLRYPVFYPLVNPGLDRRQEDGDGQLNIVRANWWCPAIESEKPAIPPFLTPIERKQAEADWKAFHDVPAAPTFLGRIAIEWAKSHPEDPRSPEALHLSVRATRHGCTGQGNGDVSKAAYTLLQSKWPKSDWARKTPYWFK